MAAERAVIRLLAETDRPTTYRVEAAPLISRLEAFLPELAKANEALTGMSPEEREVERVEEGMRHIEMNVEICKEGEMVSEEELMEEGPGEEELRDQGSGGR